MFYRIHCLGHGSIYKSSYRDQGNEAIPSMNNPFIAHTKKFRIALIIEEAKSFSFEEAPLHWMVRLFLPLLEFWSYLPYIGMFSPKQNVDL